MPTDDIEPTWGEAIGAMRSRLLALPAKTAPRAIRLKIAAQVSALILSEMVGPLAQLDGVEIAVTMPLRPADSEADRGPVDE